MKKILPFLLLLFFSWVSNPLKASDIMGADMSYKCLGNDSFEFTTVVYKDCNANWSIPANTYNLSISAANSCNFTTMQANPVLVSCQDITPVCGTSCTKCQSSCNSSSSNSGCSFAYGIEKLTFKVTVFLGNTSCCKFNVGYIGNSTRNYATTTCCNSDIFYTYLELDRCVTPCNNSPQLTNDPVGILCAGQDFSFNNGALDTIDGDSLSFELAPALKGPGQNATYFQNFTFQRPLSFLGFPNTNSNKPAGFHLDPSSGDLEFRPTRANEIAVVVIKIKEWRKINGTWTVIGETRRDMQYIIVACTNKVPTITPQSPAKACSGQQVCVPIVTNDQDRNDTTMISWNGGITGATFTHNNGQARLAQGQVCWTPTDADVSSVPYTFTAKVWDDACPLKGQSIRSFQIIVYESPKTNTSYNILNCGRVSFNSTPTKNFGTLQYSWTFRDSLGNSLRSSSKKQDTIQLPPGKIIITHTVTSTVPCQTPYIDTIIVPPYVNVNLPADTLLCEGSSISLTAVGTGGSPGYTYQWSTSSSQTSNNIQLTPNSDTTIRVFITDQQNCTNSDSIKINLSPLPPVNIGSDNRICFNQTALFDAGNDSMTLSYLWFPSGDTTRTVNLNSNGNIIARVTDSVGCSNYDTAVLNVNYININAGSDRDLCRNDTVQLQANGADNYNWVLASNGQNVSNDRVYTYIAAAPATFYVRGIKTESGLTCENFDTLNVGIKELPVINLRTQNICEDYDNFDLSSLIINPTLTTGFWFSRVNTAFIQGTSTFKTSIAGANPAPGHEVFYRVTDNQGCTNTQRTFLQVRPKPTLNVKDSTICSNIPSLRLNSLFLAPTPNPSNGVATWEETANPQRAQISGTALSGFNINTSNLNPGTYPLVYKFTDLFGCTNKDTASLVINLVPTVEVGINSQVCINGFPVNIDSTAKPSPTGGTWTPMQGANLSQGYFNPAIVANPNGIAYWFKYSYSLAGCEAADSISVTVNPLPTVDDQITTEEICLNSGIIALTGSPAPGSSNGIWTGTGVNNNNFDPSIAGPGTHILNYEYTNPLTRCKNSDTGRIIIRDIPTINITGTTEACEGNPFPLQATIQNANGLIWTSNGDGVFDAPNSGSNSSTNPNTNYFPGTNDNISGNFTITARTTGSGVCPDDIKQLNIVIYPVPQTSITVDPDSGCVPLEVNFTTNTTLPDDSVSFNWTFGNGQTSTLKNPTYTYSNHGSYNATLRVISNHNCESNNSLPILVFPNPEAAMDASRWRTTIVSPNIQFFDRSTIPNPGRIVSWTWNFGDLGNNTSNLQNPSFNYPTDTGSFFVILEVRSENNCVDTVGRWLKIDPDITVFIPNAFTPNENGIGANNTFKITADGFEKMEMRIFNRWGEEVFFTNKLEIGWDGKYKGETAQQDVYMYVVKVWNLNGKEFNYYGTVTLLR